MKLIHTKTQIEVKRGDVVKTQDEIYTISGWAESRSAASSGRVYVVRGKQTLRALANMSSSRSEQYFPNVFECEWIEREDRSVEPATLSIDASPLKPGDRVALAPHRDEWMQGDRFGEVLKIRTDITPAIAAIQLDSNRLHWIPLDSITRVR